MENPFVYGKVVRGEAFADREEEMAEVLADIESGQNVILFSPRRYGKTSLILEVLARAQDQGLLTVYLDLFKVTSSDVFVAAFAKEVAGLYRGGARSILRKVRSLLPRLVPKVVIKGERADLELEFEFDPRGDRAPLLDDLFEATERVCQEQGKRGVVAFDEFQELATWDEGGQVERQMRSHFQLHKRVSYVFMGSKRHLMEEIFQNKNRPFYRFGRHLPLAKIPQERFAQFVTDRFRQTGVQVEQEAVQEILRITDNHPYYTQLLCHILWDRFRDRGPIGREAVAAGAEEVFSREAHAFHNLWDMLPSQARQLLVALANASGPTVQIYAREFLLQHGLGPASSLQRAVARLLADEVLEKTNGGYQFTDVFFQRWIEQQFNSP